MTDPSIKWRDNVQIELWARWFHVLDAMPSWLRRMVPVRLK